jgi:hypothetical protein
MHKFCTVKAILSLCIGLVFTASLIVTPGMARTSQEMGGAKPSQKDKPQKEETITINGKVKSATADALTVVDDQNAEQTIALSAKTKITKAGKSAKADDIKADDAVVVVASKGEGGALIAVTITVA